METAQRRSSHHDTAVPQPDFRTLFEALPGRFLAVLADEPRFTMVAASDEYVRGAGKSREELLGRGLFEVFFGEPDPSHAETGDNLRASLQRVIATRQPDHMPVQQYDVPRPAAEGGGWEERYWSPVNSPSAGPDGAVQFIIHRVEDVTAAVGVKRLAAERERADRVEAELSLRCNELNHAKQLTRERERAERELRESEARLRFLSEIDDATRPLTDPHEITQAAARLLGEHLQANRCAYADVEEDADTFNLTGDYNREVPSIVGRYTFTQFGAECLRLMREGEAYVVEDAEIDPRTEQVRASYRLTSIRSVICVPLLKQGRFVAAMAVHQVTPRRWRQDEIELVQQVANRCWESIERTRVTRESREREERFRFLAESIPQMVWTATPDGLLDYVNGQGVAYFGVLREALLGAGWLAGVHPEDQQGAIERWQHSLRTGERYETAFRLRRGSDGSWRWHLARALPLVGEGGNAVQWFGTCTDIEDQKQAEAHLRQQWHTFDTTLSHTPDFIFTFDLEGRFTYANRALLSLLQISLAEIVGKNFFELSYPPELAGRLQRQIQEVIGTKQVVRDQTPFTGPTGELRDYDYIFAPVLAADGGVEAVAGSTRDVTERNRTEAARRASEERLNFALEAGGGVGTWDWDVPADRLYCNAKFAQLFSVDPERAAAGAPLADFLAGIYPDDRARVGEAIQRTFITGGDFTQEYRTIHQDTSVRWIHVRGRCDLDESGAPLRFPGVVFDITERKQAEERLQESEERFRSLAATIPQLIWTATPEGNVNYLSEQWAEYIGLPPERLYDWGWEQVVHPDDLAGTVRDWTRSIQKGEPLEIRHRFRYRTGEWRWQLVRGVTIKDGAGQVTRWVGTCTDIHDQIESEAALRRANRELEEFAYVASHDLQEPLRMVNIYTHLILKKLPGEHPDLAEFAGFVRTGVLRMEKLIQDLLTFSRTVHPESLPVGVADLTASLAEARSVLESRIEESGAVIVAGPLPPVFGDTGQFAHVLQNLLSNALKYRKKDAVPEIHIAAERDGEQWVVAVRDNGIGFEQQYAERIFGLFKRLHKDEYPGTGLGLAICQRIVERYGGRMWAEGRLGEGATFFFSLPRVDGA